MFQFSPARVSPNFLKTAAVVLGCSLVGITSASAAALPQFTWDPAGAGLLGTSFTADNIILSDYSTVVLTPNGSGGADFTDNGVLAVVGFQLASSPVAAFGLDSTYGLYYQFTSTGTQSTPDFNSSTTGTFTTLDYTLFGYNVTGPVTYLPDNVTPLGVVAPIALASGTLIAGAVGATTIPGGIPVPTASVLLNFTPTVLPFFASPFPFYNKAFASFTNTESEVEFTPTGFIITQGGGSNNFLNVPEPASLAILGVGIVGLGMIRSRRYSAGA